MFCRDLMTRVGVPKPIEEVPVTRLIDRARQQITTTIAGDWQALAALYAPDASYTDPDGALTGSDQVIERLRGQVDAMPGCSALVRHAHADVTDGAGGSGTVVLEWTLSAPAGTPTPVTLDVVTVYEFRDALIAAERNYWDNAHLAAQLGVDMDV
jgi:ketosteroid isomerase-like protein